MSRIKPCKKCGKEPEMKLYVAPFYPGGYYDYLECDGHFKTDRYDAYDGGERKAISEWNDMMDNAEAKA